ncbi:MAG: alanine racemase [bacterium]
MTITQPTLLVDEHKCKANIAFMAARAKSLGVDFRPHFKTHQSLEVGRWFKEYGVTKITVSSLSMAQYFAAEWNDITVAFPVNILEISTINELAAKIRLNLLVESTDSLQYLAKHLKHKVRFYIKVNIGNQRAGVLPEDDTTIKAMLEISENSAHLHFLGFLGHAGQTYGCRGKAAIQAAHDAASAQLVAVKNRYEAQYPNCIASYGDTPSCSVADNFEGIDEIRPGNFVFYDVMQTQIGACSDAQIAVAMACPIVAIHEAKNELIVYGGGIHLAKDRIEVNGKVIYGKVVQLTKDGWSKPLADCHVKKISQEHGVLQLTEATLKDYKVGNIIGVLPIHSCMTVDVMRSYQTLDDQVIKIYRY